MKQPGALIILFAFVAAVSFTLASEQKADVKLNTTLNGLGEVPGPGDADATGTFTATFSPGQNRLCYELKLSNIAAPNRVDIHTGNKNQVGPVLLSLALPVNGSSKDCATVDGDRIMEIIKAPENYYLNVQNEEFPDGAVRGQLGK